MHATCALVPSLRFQLLTFLAFTLLRAATFSIGSLFVARIFGFARLGTLYGLMQALGAVLSFSFPLLTAYVLESLEGDWALVHGALLLLCFLQFGLVEWAVRR